jgi:hypothetical protein
VLWDKDSIEYEILKKYESALIAIGVNFANNHIQDALENCTFGLEDALRAAISYSLWLHEQKKEIVATQILFRALTEQWKPKEWDDNFLNIEGLKSQGQKWWDDAANIWGNDVRKTLVADVFIDEGREYIKFMNGKEMLVETAWRWGWERVLEYASNYEC